MTGTVGRPMEAGTNETAGARRIAAAFSHARAEGRIALIPYVVAGYPDADTSFAVALAAADAGADLLEVGLPYSDPLADGATLQRASGVALAAGATLESSLRLLERIGAARPHLPLVPMGYANQVIGGGDGEAVAKRLTAAGAAGLIVADLTPDEGAPFEAVATGGRSGGRLSRRPDHLAGPPGLDREPQRRLPLLRVPGRRDRRPGITPVVRRQARPRREGRLAGPGRGRVRRQQARPCSGDREGRRGRRHRRVGTGGRAGARWPGCGRIVEACR